MAAPGILTGGETTLYSRNTSDLSSNSRAPRSNMGVHGKYPGATRKWALNRGPRSAEKLETMARLFIDIPRARREQLFKALPDDVKPLARVLTGTGFVDFLLTNASEPLVEKTQIVDTLTDSYVAFYSGQEPPLWQYGGTLLNTYQDDQRVWLFRLYQTLLRGTRLANRNLTVRLRYDSFMVQGYMESLSQQLTGGSDMASQFQFSLRVKTVTVITPMLALPTVPETPVATRVLLGNPDTGALAAASTRRATVTSPRPVKADGKPAAQTDAEVDPREVMSTPDDVLFSSVEQNAQNASEDAQGGLSNIRGNTDQGLESAARSSTTTRRVAPHPRGVRGTSSEPNSTWLNDTLTSEAGTSLLPQSATAADSPQNVSESLGLSG